MPPKRQPITSELLEVSEHIINSSNLVVPNLNIYPDLEWVYGTDPELSIEASVEHLDNTGLSLQVRHAVLRVAENGGAASVKVDRYWAVDYLKGDKFGRYILQKFYKHCPYDLSPLRASA